MFLFTLFAWICIGLQLYVILMWKNNILSPSFYFTFVWFFIFSVFLIGWNFLPHFHYTSASIFLSGVLFFNIGSFFVNSVYSTRIISVRKERRSDKSILFFLMIFCTSMLPAYFKFLLVDLSVESTGLNLPTLLNYIRRASVLDDRYGSSFSLLNNLPVLANFIFLSSFILLDWNKENKKLLVFALLLNVVYNTLEGSKMSAILSIIVVMVVGIYKTKKINFKYLIFVLLFTPLLFGTLVYYINYTFIEFQDQTTMLNEIGSTVKIYLLGGPIAFDTYLENNLYFGNNQAIYRPFIEFSRSLGFNISIMSRHADYIGVGSFYTNVYSMYYSLYDTMGIFIILFMFFYGVLCQLIFILGLRGNRFFAIIYPSIIISLIMSIHAENIISGLNGLVKFFIMYLIFFRILGRFLSLLGKKLNYGL